MFVGRTGVSFREGGMGWMWRKVYRFGPLRTTISNRGLGWSLGTPFLRYGIGPSGTRYISIGIPGTGLYFTKFLGRGGPRHLPSMPQQPPHPTSISHQPQQASPPPSHLTANQKILEALKNKSP